MPAIANLHRGRPYEPPSDAVRHPDSGAGLSRSVPVRIRAASQRGGLTRALAEGADPTARPEFALRAAQLTSWRNRKRLARTLGRTIAEAHGPAMTRSRVVIIRRAAVLDAEAAITAMIERLGSAKPVEPKGMAIIERMITNAGQSPLYGPSEPGALDRLIRTATAALEPGPAQSHEFPVGP
jgi:hypothetical protein